jgi:hypothetical protein
MTRRIEEKVDIVQGLAERLLLANRQEERSPVVVALPPRGA